MKIETVGINQNVCAPGGHVGRVVEISQNGQVHLDFGPNNFHYAPFFVGDLTPVSDPCQECEMAATITSQCEQIAELQGKLDKAYTRFGEQDLELARTSAERDNWEATAAMHCRNETYWREELTKLQKEALAECKSLGEVAKIYVMPSIEKQLAELAKFSWEKPKLSDDAKIVCELLEGSGPMTSLQIADRLNLQERCILENLIEAREAGIVQLVDGKYQIVRD